MTDRDNITLPREVVQEALEALAKTPCNSVYEQDCTPCNAEEALRKALAAKQPKHPGYVIGSHWLETAYSRVCAGEAEADVLRDIGLVREEAFLAGVAHLKAENEALRRENERLREMLRDTTVNLGAAVSLLKNGGKKTAASDKMFEQMLVDYTNSFERGRAALRREDV